MTELIRQTFPVPPLGCNCSILGDPKTKEAIVIDPGGDAEHILSEVKRLGLTVKSIVHTHAHFDGEERLRRGRATVYRMFQSDVGTSM